MSTFRTCALGVLLSVLSIGSVQAEQQTLKFRLITTTINEAVFNAANIEGYGVSEVDDDLFNLNDLRAELWDLIVKNYPSEDIQAQYIQVAVPQWSFAGGGSQSSSLRFT